jgi:hypothetical protein
VEVEAFATDLSLVQESPNKCLNKITKPPVRGGQGLYKDCRATDDDYDDEDEFRKISGAQNMSLHKSNEK